MILAATILTDTLGELLAFVSLLLGVLLGAAEVARRIYVKHREHILDGRTLDKVAAWFPDDVPGEDGGLPGEMRRLRVDVAQLSHDLREHMAEELQTSARRDRRILGTVRRMMQEHREELASVLEGRAPVDVLRQPLRSRIEDEDLEEGGT